MNELLFLVHTLLVVGFALFALKMGKAALTAWIGLQAVLANLFVIKQIPFFGFHVTCSDVFAVGCIFGLNLLREYYGQETAQKALWTCFFAMLFFVAMAQIHLAYTPSPFDATQSSFEQILSASPRLLAASLLVFILVQQVELRLFGLLKDRFPILPLGCRNALSVSATQFLDTFFFSILGLWGIVSHLFDVIVVSFVIKLLVIMLMTPLVHFSKRFAARPG